MNLKSMLCPKSDQNWQKNNTVSETDMYIVENRNQNDFEKKNINICTDCYEIGDFIGFSKLTGN